MEGWAGRGLGEGGARWIPRGGKWRADLRPGLLGNILRERVLRDPAARELCDEEVGVEEPQLLAGVIVPPSAPLRLREAARLRRSECGHRTAASLQPPCWSNHPPSAHLRLWEDSRLRRLKCAGPTAARRGRPEAARPGETRPDREHHPIRREMRLGDARPDWEHRPIWRGDRVRHPIWRGDWAHHPICESRPDWAHHPVQCEDREHHPVQRREIGHTNQSRTPDRTGHTIQSGGRIGTPSDPKGGLGTPSNPEEGAE